jgi:hypothetical protein
MAVMLPNPEYTGHTETVERPDEVNLGDQLEKIAADVKILGRLAKEDVKRKIGVARDRGQEAYGRMHTKGRVAMERRPLTSLAAAAGLGVVACLLWTRGLGR